MILLIDVDGVLRDIYQPMIQIYKERYDPTSDVSVEDIQQYDLSPTFPKVDSWEAFFRRYAGEIFYDASAYPMATEVLQELYNKGYTIHIVTNQLPGIEIYTLEWLQKYEVPYNSISFTANKHHIKGRVLLDDNPDTLWAARHESLPTTLLQVCMARPWNRNYDGLFVSDMVEFATLLEDFYGDLGEMPDVE